MRRYVILAALSLSLHSGNSFAQQLAWTNLASVPAATESLALKASYQGRVRWYIADLKTSFPEHQRYSSQTAITDRNYMAVLDGLKNNAKVNGVRLPIFPSKTSPEQYSATYKSVVSYARRLGLAVYASPLSVGMAGVQNWSAQRYAAWLANYANYFAPDFLSPFNEAGIENERIVETVAQLRPLLRSGTLLVGPDRQHVQRTIRDLASDPALAAQFDIVDSHNAAKDYSATQPNWANLVGSYGKPVWAAEDPSNWSVGTDPSLPGMAEAVEGGVEGIVVWAAKPGLVDDQGRPTRKALDIAAHLAR